jgi:hypothetical protein
MEKKVSGKRSEQPWRAAANSKGKEAHSYERRGTGKPPPETTRSRNTEKAMEQPAGSQARTQGPGNTAGKAGAAGTSGRSAAPGTA